MELHHHPERFEKLIRLFLRSAYVHQMVLLEEFERSGCQVHFLDQPIRQDSHDHLLLQIRGAVAESRVPGRCG